MTARWLPRVFLVYLIWIGVGFIVLPFGLTQETARTWLLPGWPQIIGSIILSAADAFSLWLAATVTVLYLWENAGTAAAFIAVVGIVLVTAGIESGGVVTGLPFGPYRYTDQLGYRLFGFLPVTIPAAWLVIVVNAHFVLPDRWFRPLLVGGIAAGTDLSLEFVAWKVRHYWIWYPNDHDPPAWPPWQNFASWLVIAAALDLVFLRRVQPTRSRLVPGVMLATMNLLFWVTLLFGRGFSR